MQNARLWPGVFIVSIISVFFVELEWVANMLTKSDLQFLDRHNISLSVVFDATGLKKAEYSEEMDQLDMLVAFGVTPCKKYGHRLRDKYGHCIRCEPAYIAFIKRGLTDGYVYVAGSKSGRLIKIGCASDIDKRLAGLRSSGYAGTRDWIILGKAYVEKAGKVELEAHSRLEKYRKNVPYLIRGVLVVCQEVFRCDSEDAFSALEAALGKSGRVVRYEFSRDEYSFRSVEGEDFELPLEDKRLGSDNGHQSGASCDMAFAGIGEVVSLETIANHEVRTSASNNLDGLNKKAESHKEEVHLKSDKTSHDIEADKSILVRMLLRKEVILILLIIALKLLATVF